MEVKAVAKDTGLSPRKVRLIAETIRGKKVDEALAILRFTPTPTARAIAKVVKSASANAENNFQLSPSSLKVVSVLADKAPSLKRFRARARGAASQILKRSSHITVVVTEVEG